MPKPPRDCPCHSKLRYADCCAPYHREEREAPTCEALMRSRYSGFALGFGKYLMKTLAKTHEDRALPPAALELELARAKDEQRYLDLCILDTKDTDAGGEVLFYAKVFAKGQDRSFAELSTFVREEGGLRYASAILVPRPEIPGEPRALTREAFLAIPRPVVAPTPAPPPPA